MKKIAHNLEEASQYLTDGAVLVYPTDTVFGVLADAKNPAAVELIYSIKNRSLGKACIVLISDINQVADFGVALNQNIRLFMDTVWPGPNSVIISLQQQALGTYSYLHRGTNALAFRLPSVDSPAYKLVHEFGPVVAPSANIEGAPTGQNIDQVYQQLGDKVAYYKTDLVLAGNPSSIYQVSPGGFVEKIR